MVRARVVESEVRLTTEVVAVAGLVRELATRIVGSKDWRRASTISIVA